MGKVGNYIKLDYYSLEYKIAVATDRRKLCYVTGRMNMQAIILAAGMGKRLKDLTKHSTKCMVQVNGTSLIERMLTQLDRLALERIIIVIGYEGRKLKEYIDSLNVKTSIIYVENTIYAKTNNIYSLALAKAFMVEDDTLLLESDLIFEDSVLRSLLDDSRETLAVVDKYESWMDGTCIKIGKDDCIEAFISKKEFRFEDIAEYYKTVNIYKFSRHFSVTHYVPFLEAYCAALGNNEYYEQVLKVITMLDDPKIKAKKLTGQLWYEIDDVQDLDIAASMFVGDRREKLQRISKRLGGYWRYPKLLNCSYPCNPFFPPSRLVCEMEANMNKLISEYPSGMEVDALLAAKNLGIPADCVIAANGIDEIIHSIMSVTAGKVGCVKPVREEFISRCGKDRVKTFMPVNRDLSYTAEDIIRFFEREAIDILLLANPEYHTGNYIEKYGMKQILEWGNSQGLKMIIDESYCDFADESDNSLMKLSILENYSNLFVMKNISVTHGVAGLRLGCAASANEEWLNEVSKNLAVWNINSVAEFYLQIVEKYQEDYQQSLILFKDEKRKFAEELSKISGIYPIPSQANYYLCELEGELTSERLAGQLLDEYNILVKDMSEIINNGNQYIKIAIKSEEENLKLLETLKTVVTKI